MTRIKSVRVVTDVYFMNYDEQGNPFVMSAKAGEVIEVRHFHERETGLLPLLSLGLVVPEATVVVEQS